MCNVQHFIVPGLSEPGIIKTGIIKIRIQPSVDVYKRQDQIIRTDPVQGIAAYIVLPQPVWQELQALYGQRMQVLHPLQIAARKTHQGPTVEINFAGDWANITVKDVRLQYCERCG